MQIASAASECRLTKKVITKYVKIKLNTAPQKLMSPKEMKLTRVIRLVKSM